MSIQLRTLSVTAGNKSLLKDIDLTIAPGKLTVLVGPNGAGKSTLLKTCSGDLNASAGNIIINEHDIQTLSHKQLSQIRAVMTQSYEMGFGFNVKEIVAMGCFAYEGALSSRQQDIIIHSVMKYLEIEELSERNFMTLSGGEQQRTQLARVLAQLWHPYEQEQPRYLLLDEPTSSLDIFHQYRVLELAKQLGHRNIGVLAVVHDLSLAASFADHLVMLANGRIVAQGKPEAVLQRSKLAEVYGIHGHYFQQSTAVKPAVLLDINQ